MSILSDLRIDIGDDAPVLGSVSGVPTLLSHLQVDIGNDRQTITSTQNVTELINVQIDGYVAITPTIVTGSYSVPSDTNSTILVNNTSGASVTVTLPPNPVTGQIVIVKDMAGNAVTWDIIVSPFSGLIDGFPTFTITNAYQSVTFYYTGLDWSII